MNIDDTDVRRLTSNTADDAWPRRPPNGKQITFHSNADGGDFERYTVDADGADLTRVTNRPGVDQWPDWSPDGKKLAIRRDMDAGTLEMDELFTFVGSKKSPRISSRSSKGRRAASSPTKSAGGGRRR